MKEQLEKVGSLSPEFWDWLPRAYHYEGTGNFTKYNMEVAWNAGREQLEKEHKMKANTYKVLARAVEEGVLVGWNRAHKHLDNPDPDQIKFQVIEAVLNEICEWMDFEDQQHD